MSIQKEKPFINKAIQVSTTFINQCENMSIISDTFLFPLFFQKNVWEIAQSLTY